MSPRGQTPISESPFNPKGLYWAKVKGQLLAEGTVGRLLNGAATRVAPQHGWSPKAVFGSGGLPLDRDFFTRVLSKTAQN